MEPTGMDTFVACRHEGVELSACSASATISRPARTIHLQPDLQRAHLFDAATGQRRRLAADAIPLLDAARHPQGDIDD